MRLLLAALVMAAIPALAQVEVRNAWSRATPGGARVAAGYMLILNQGAADDRLLGVRATAAERIEMHETRQDGEILRMREVTGYAIPANGSYELKPGGAHLMLVNIKAPFKVGDRVPVVLKFARAGEIKAELHVGHQPDSAPAHRH